MMMENGLKCPRGHGTTEIVMEEKQAVFRGVEISYSVEIFRCPACSLEAATMDQMAEIQKALIGIEWPMDDMDDDDAW